MKFSTTLKEIFTTKELRKRVFYTAFFALLYCIGTFIILPWINPQVIINQLKQSKSEIQSFFDRALITSFKNRSIFSLGIGPYIQASILVQLASFAIPYFQRLEKEGSSGRSKLDTITRWLTVPIAIGQSLIILLSVETHIMGGARNIVWFYLTSTLLMTSIAVFSIWLADQITEKGLSNGSSVLIMVNSVVSLPAALRKEISQKWEANNVLFLVIEFIILFAIILSVILFMRGVRKIILQYARQMMSNYGPVAGAHQYLPIKMNATGIMPVMFASVFIGLLANLISFVGRKLTWTMWQEIAKVLGDPYCWKFNLLQSILIFIGTVMYMTVFINPIKIANELKRSNAFVSGVQPGRPTADFIDKITTRVVLPGAVFLVIICLLPAIAASKVIGVEQSFAEYYGRTSLLIIVSVFLGMIDQIKGHLNMHYYDTVVRDAEKMPEI